MKITCHIRTLALAGAFLFSVLACSGQDKEAKQVVGTWTKTSQMGTVTLVISKDLKWEVKFTGGDEADVWGSCEVIGDQITFTDKGGAYSSDSSGIYEFEVSDTSINFIKVNDPVDGRSMLVEGSWSKAGTDP